MLDDQLLRLITSTSEILELEDSVIEKDYYVTQMIHTLSDVENEYFRLIFSGGTCLAKAHKVVQRMSEDVDFKIQAKNTTTTLSKSRFLKELKQFRLQIMSKLTLPGFTIVDRDARNEGRYSWVKLDYPSPFPPSTRLRPDILLEFTLADIRLSTETFPVKTLIEDTLETIAIFEPPITTCISVGETAIEKWVGLTRRVIAIERQRDPDDETLIRHVYDLSIIKQAGRINNKFFNLAKEIVYNDAKQFKNQHPEYSVDPCAEILQSLELLKTKSLWKTRYEGFIEVMVYDGTSDLEYDNAIQLLEKISSRVIDTLGFT